MRDVFATFKKPTRTSINYRQFKKVVSTLDVKKEYLQNNDLMYLVFRRFDVSAKNRLTFEYFSKMFSSSYEFRSFSKSTPQEHHDITTPEKFSTSNSPFKTPIHKFIDAHFLAESKLEKLVRFSIFNLVKQREIIPSNFVPRQAYISMLSGIPPTTSIVSIKLSKHQWRSYMQELLPSTSTVLSDLLFTYYDGDKNGYMTYVEFLEELTPRLGA